MTFSTANLQTLQSLKIAPIHPSMPLQALLEGSKGPSKHVCQCCFVDFVRFPPSDAVFMFDLSLLRDVAVRCSSSGRLPLMASKPRLLSVSRHLSLTLTKLASCVTPLDPLVFQSEADGGSSSVFGFSPPGAGWSNVPRPTGSHGNGNNTKVQV